TPPEAPMAPAPGPHLERAKAMVANAQRPVMIAGVGAVHHAASAVIRRVCEAFQMPLLTTYKAKGLLPEDHPLALGGHGLSPVADNHVLPLLERADLVLLVGYDPIEMRAGWRDPFDPAKVIELTHTPNRHGMHGAAVSFVGHVGASLEVLTAGVTPAQPTWPEGEADALGARLAERFGDRPQWGPHAAFAAARRIAPRETVVTADSGAHRILLSQMWTCYAPQTLLQSTALCTMGCALPLAMGYKLANPTQPVLAIMGDAGLEMVLGELATLRDWRLPVVVMVMVDESLALIELKQRRSGLANLGVDFPPSDFPAVAEALGGVGRWIASVEALEAELAGAWQRDTFTLLACDIGRKAYDGAF
ncbi:MAG: thiamine pyrophosphate-binding protein, partial [Candidatus Competibacterales bacterium]